MVQIDKVLIISEMSLKEILKSKISYQILFLSLIIGIVSFISSRFTFGIPDKVALDIGMGLISLSSIGMSLFFGIGLISKEIESRTLYLILSRPVGRIDFLIGKLLGLASVLLLNWIVLSLVLSGILFTLHFSFSWFYLSSLFFILLESILVLFIMVMLSLIANPVISLLGSLVLLLTGHLVGDLMVMEFVKSNTIFTKIIEIFKWFFPHYYKLNFKNFLLYNQEIDTSIQVYAFLYWFTCLGVVLFLSIVLFSKKSLD